MQLTKVRLRNFGPYEDTTFELSQGLVGIIGPNGSGKSTLVNGIYACLTNDFSRFGGRKPGIIRDTAEEKAKSFIEVHGEHHNSSFRLVRNLRPNSSKLVMGDFSYTKAADIEKHLIRDLGLNRKLIDAYVFVNQWDMFSFLSQTDSKRAEVFQSLCGTEKSIDIYTACTKFAEDDRFSINVLDNGDEIKSQLSLLRKELTTLRFQREKHCKYLMKDKTRENAEKIVRRRDILVSQQDELLTCKQSLNILNNKVRELKVTLIDKKQEREKLDGFIESASKNLSGLEIDRMNHTHAQHQDARRRELSIALTKHKRSKPELKIPKKKVCPTCEQQVNNDKLIEIMKSQYQEKLQAYNKKVNNIQSLLDDIEVNKEHLKFNLDVWDSAKDTCYDLEVDQENLRDQIVTIEKDMARQSGERHACFQRLKELKTHLQGSSLDEYNKLYDRAKRRLQDHYTNKAEVDSLDGATRVKSESITNCKKLLVSLRKRMEKRAKYDDLLHVIKKARDLFHWQNLPRQVAQANLASITGEINVGLESFGNPFWVEADTNLSFKVHFPGAPTRSAASLSGGQKVILAICFRSAVNKLFGDNIGMMFLDEPTSGLDDDNIEYFKTVLAHMSRKIKYKYQLFVITHAQALSSAFDKTISIGV